jgi:phage baseplate assembly protein W
MAIDNEKTFKNKIAGKNDDVFDYLPAVNPLGDFTRIDGINVIINSIRTLLLTPLGFYPFDPTYGSLLYKKVFEPLDDISKEEIEYEVSERIREFDPRINITEVNILELSVDEKGLVVEIFIERGDLKGTVSVHLPGPNYQFALEDD